MDAHAPIGAILDIPILFEKHVIQHLPRNSQLHLHAASRQLRKKVVCFYSECVADELGKIKDAIPDSHVEIKKAINRYIPTTSDSASSLQSVIGRLCGETKEDIAAVLAQLPLPLLLNIRTRLHPSPEQHLSAAPLVMTAILLRESSGQFTNCSASDRFILARIFTMRHLSKNEKLCELFFPAYQLADQQRYTQAIDAIEKIPKGIVDQNLFIILKNKLFVKIALALHWKGKDLLPGRKNPEQLAGVVLEELLYLKEFVWAETLLQEADKTRQGALIDLYLRYLIITGEYEKLFAFVIKDRTLLEPELRHELLTALPNLPSCTKFTSQFPKFFLLLRVHVAPLVKDIKEARQEDFIHYLLLCIMTNFQTDRIMDLILTRAERFPVADYSLVERAATLFGLELFETDYTGLKTEIEAHQRPREFLKRPIDEPKEKHGLEPIIFRCLHIVKQIEQGVYTYNRDQLAPLLENELFKRVIRTMIQTHREDLLAQVYKDLPRSQRASLKSLWLELRYQALDSHTFAVPSILMNTHNPS